MALYLTLYRAFPMVFCAQSCFCPIAYRALSGQRLKRRRFEENFRTVTK
jgi:hypothetical protein